ncbi:thermonuclease family protein [Calothrix sp. FACHB-156]|nr:thermonuclease family protein [Calothrix sp. FACHB-156]
MELLEIILVLAKIVGVVDAETIRLKDNAGQKITLKLACIHVPKATTQAIPATRKLKQLLPPLSPVVIRRTEKLGSDRIVGEVFVNNRSVNLLMVESGNAVVDRESLQNCSESKTQYLIAEANAKNHRWGLWQQLNNPMTQTKIFSRRGKLIYEEIPPVMSVRAYLGEEFFLISNTSNQSRLVLRPSVQVSRDQLLSFQNQEVEITAEYVEGTRPSPNQIACPLDADGQCMPQGAGYQVLSIKLAK